ncbi:uncharacterized protein FSUBG_1386 [Fusarium subglutinans]|uniref:Uncharacterized protein n=1 Tax=Gibberella subglutinans TaxID=42677 RepID=A0A8H5QC81_GIBSU|nr:uncharacterized protein FSUBG_1386 [Fusarium subglutinans]KAF5612579.1 hypothetical protein FSUBG_1386 [Fusarium subglutinans]
MPGSSFSTDAFCNAAEALFRDASHQSIIPRHLVRSYFEAEGDVSQLEILEVIIEYFQDPAPGKRRETFIVSPFNDSINFLVRYGAHSHERSLTILGTSDEIRNVPVWLVQLIDAIFCIMRLRMPSFRPEVFSWSLDQQRLGFTLLALLGRFVHLGTSPSDNRSLSMFPAIQDIRNEGFWDIAGRVSRSQLSGGGLGLVDCSETMEEDQIADDEGESSQAQPRSRARSRSRPALHIDMELRTKSSSHEDKGDLYSDSEQESDQSSETQSETAEFSSQEDSVPDAGVKAPVKARSTPLVPTFTEADLIFPLTQPDELKLVALFAATIQVAQLQTLVYYSREEASYCMATAAIDWASVSIVAEGLAPNDLKGLYAPEVCRQLYESDENAEFRRKALLGPNWEKLRGVSAFEGEQPQEGDPFGLNDVDSGQIVKANAESVLRQRFPAFGLGCPELAKSAIVSERDLAKTLPIRNHKRPARCVGAITLISSTKANVGRDAQKMGDDLDRGCDGSWRRPEDQRCQTEDEADDSDNENSEHGGEDTEKDEDSESWD